MSHAFSKHPFDTMFVILCVIAGASSHSSSNSSRNTTTHLLNHRYRYSFIDLILDASLIEPPHTPKTTRNPELFDNKHQSHQLDTLPSNDNNLKQSYNVCALLSNILGGSQMRFCNKHQEVLEQVLPQVIELAKEECVKITSDLRWNCTTMDQFLNRSNTLGGYQDFIKLL
ncbi:MAG: hypothetical protein EOP45_19475 [Sphingobacteriaceae bacterium]|nr:MAG: hypothetical protein EOP45_19475 [Sphingobacteriaceae bacterium]